MFGAISIKVLLINYTQAVIYVYYSIRCHELQDLLHSRDFGECNTCSGQCG